MMMTKILLKYFMLPGLAFGVQAALSGVMPGPLWARAWTVCFGFIAALLVAGLLAPPRSQDERKG
jgi:hypothetical protein